MTKIQPGLRGPQLVQSSPSRGTAPTSPQSAGVGQTEYSTGKGLALRRRAAVELSGVPPVAARPLQQQARSLEIGTNYTDIGTDTYGLSTDPVELRREIAEDLQHLASMGITDVRVWAMGYLDSGQGLAGNPDFARMRLQLILEEASRLGMHVTVDVMDLQRPTGTLHDEAGNVIPQPDTQALDSASAEHYRAVLESVVTPAVRAAREAGANLSNITFSVGNEPAGPNDPGAFADWFVARAGDLRGALRAAGLSQPTIVAELIPFSVGDPPDAAAMAEIVRAVDAVSVHFYAPGPVDPDNPEYSALLQWAGAAGRKPFTVGEFGAMPGVADRDNVLMGWLRQMETDGIGGVRLWQFGKNENTAGHTDDRSLQDAGGLHELLRQEQFLP